MSPIAPIDPVSAEEAVTVSPGLTVGENASTSMATLLGSLARIRGFMTEDEQRMWGRPAAPPQQSLWFGAARESYTEPDDVERDDQELRDLYDLRVQVACRSLSELTDDDISRLAMNASIPAERIAIARERAVAISADGPTQRSDAARQLFKEFAELPLPVDGTETSGTDLLDELRKTGKWPGDLSHPLVQEYSALLAATVHRHARFARWRTIQLYGSRPRALLVLAAVEGLRRALERFEPDRGFKLTTYAGHWVRSRVNRVLADFGTDIRVPVHLRDDRQKARRVVREILIQAGRLPELPALLALGAAVMPNFARVLPGAYAPLRDAWTPIGADGACEIDLVFDERRLGLQRTRIRPEIAAVLREGIDGLTRNRQREIVLRRFGLDGRTERETLEAIGKSHQITRERIRQVEEKALAHLAGAVGERLSDIVHRFEFTSAPSKTPLS